MKYKFHVSSLTFDILMEKILPNIYIIDSAQLNEGNTHDFLVSNTQRLVLCQLLHVQTWPKEASLNVNKLATYTVDDLAAFH